MMKLVLRVDVNDSKSRREAMRAVSELRGVDSLSINAEKKTMTVVGEVDPVDVVCKLRKIMAVQIESAGPNKEEEKNKDENNTNEELEDIIRNYYHNYGNYYSYY